MKTKNKTVDVYPSMNQEYRNEWEAWRAMSKIIGEKDATNHRAGCQCVLFSCRLFNAVRAWGATIVGDEKAVRLGLRTGGKS